MHNNVQRSRLSRAVHAYDIITQLSIDLCKTTDRIVLLQQEYVTWGAPSIIRISTVQGKIPYHTQLNLSLPCTLFTSSADQLAQ